MEQYYLKQGRRYRPVSIFAGWPADGVWFVRKKGAAATLVAKIDDLHGLDFQKLGNLAQAHSVIANALIEMMGSTEPLTINDRASKIIEALSKCDEWNERGPF